MTINITGLPSNLLVPGQYVSIDNSLANSGSLTKKVLIMGQMSDPSPNFTPKGERGKILQVFDLKKCEELYGKSSHLYHMISAYLNANPQVELHVLPIQDNPTGKQAKATITTIDDITKDTTYRLYIMDKQLDVLLSTGDTAIQIATKIIDVLNTSDLPLKAEVNSKNDKLIDITSEHKGEWCNDISMYANKDNTYQTTITPFMGGSNNPLIDDYLKGVISDDWYNWLVLPYTDTKTITDFSNFADERYGSKIQKGMRAFISFTSDDPNILMQKASVINSPHITIMGANSQQLPSVISAINCSAVSQIMALDPTITLHGTPLIGLNAKSFNFDVRNSFLNKGISTYNILPDGRAELERQVLSYTENGEGQPDNSYLEIQIVETMEAMRYERNILISSTFKGYKVSKSDKDTYRAGNKVINPIMFKAFLLSYYKTTLINDKAWFEDYDNYKKTLVVEVNSKDHNRIDYQEQPTLIGRFEIGAGLSTFKK